MNNIFDGLLSRHESDGGKRRLPKPKMSVNRTAWRLAQKLCDKAEVFGVTAEETRSGVIIIDAGIRTSGGFLAGEIITEICLGGYGKARVFSKEYDGLEFPSIFVHTDHPALATLGSQYAGWNIKVGKYRAMGSGPARALALKPKELYDKIEYRDEADVAVLVLETGQEPPEEVIAHICDQCNVAPDHLLLILVPTATIAGSTQISGRVVETGIHKLTELGLDPRLITHAWGYAPIAPVHPKFAESMGRTNDAILYAGVTGYTIDYEDDGKLRQLIERAPSSASKSYGSPFIEIFRNANHDFYKIDPNLFAPAVLIVNNAKTGSTLQAGEVNMAVFKRSLGLQA